MGICDNSGKFKNDNNNKESSPINEREKKNKNNNVNIYSVQNNNGNIDISHKTVINNNNPNKDEIFSKKNDTVKDKKEEEIDNNENNSVIMLLKDQSEKIGKQMKMCICRITIKKKGIYEMVTMGTGFLCKIPFPDESNVIYSLMTNCHVLNTNNKEELSTIENFKINFDDGKIERILDLSSERKMFSIYEADMDFTVIEIFPEFDKIFHFLEIELIDITNKNIGKNIYIHHHPGGSTNCKISYGKIKDVENYTIYHDCSTKSGSSGSPIFLLDNYKLIGIHSNYDTDIELNFGTSLKVPIEKFNSKFSDKKNADNNNYVNCIISTYLITKGEELDLLHDYNKQKKFMVDDELFPLYNEGKKKKNALEKNINIYIDDKPINFTYKYKIDETDKKEIEVKFIFKKIFNDLSFLFYKCKNLKKIDLSPFDSKNVTNMSYIFSGCESLNSIDFGLINTSNVTNISNMFGECGALGIIDLSSFNMTNVINMKKMFFGCSKIRRLDLSSFNTINVTDMGGLFANCYNLKYLYLKSFKTDNVVNMKQMFSRCSDLKTLKLSFNTTNVENMDGMFEYCSSLELLDIHTFNTINVKDMQLMFQNCASLKSLDLSSFNTINVTRMNSMFIGNFSLETLDLSSFNTINVTNMDSIFVGCLSLKNINCKDQKILNSAKQNVGFIKFHL